MKKLIKNNIRKIIVGFLFLAFGFAVYFVPTTIEFPFYLPIIAWVIGLLLIFAGDRFINILTFGLSGLSKKYINKNNTDTNERG